MGFRPFLNHTRLFEEDPPLNHAVEGGQRSWKRSGLPRGAWLPAGVASNVIAPLEPSDRPWPARNKRLNQNGFERFRSYDKTVRPR